MVQKRLHNGETYVVSAFLDFAAHGNPHGVLGVFDDLEIALKAARSATDIYVSSDPYVLFDRGSFIWRCLNNVFNSQAVPIFKREYIWLSRADKKRSWAETWNSPAHEALAKKFS